MTIEQIVAQHPCPIIRGKIMENVGKERTYKDLEDVIFVGFNWKDTPQGWDFWGKTINNITDGIASTYSDLKHLDLSYVPEPAKPPVMWRKIDPNNLCADCVVAIDNDHTPKQVVKGTLELTEDDRIRLYIGAGSYMYRFTHYIPLSELINLPIE
jgi:hypothetical protein